MSELRTLPQLRPEDLSPRIDAMGVRAWGFYWGLLGVSVWSSFYGSLFLLALIGIALGYGLLGVFTDQFKLILIELGFVRVRETQRFLRSIYMFSALSFPFVGAAAVLVRLPGLPSDIANFPIWPPILFLLGLDFFLLGLTVSWIRLLRPEVEGRFCLLQFLATSKSNWLRAGLGIVERCLSTLGMPLPQNTLVLGADYGLANGSVKNPDLEEFASWLNDARAASLPPTTLHLVSLANEAVDAGFQRPRTWFTRMIETPTLAKAFSWTITVSAGFLTIMKLLGLF